MIKGTVTQKALRLYPGLTIESLGKGLYFVESESKPDTFYRVSLSPFEDDETCDCPATKPCYHIGLATIYRAKVTARRRREADPPRSPQDRTRQPRASGGALVTTRRGTDGEGLRGREF